MLRSSFPLATLVLISLCAPACSTNVTTGTTGAGGSSSTTTSTTSTTSTAGTGGSSSTTSSVVTVGVGGGPPAFCGGKAGIPCGPDEWCQFDPVTPCGNADGAGICQARPEACDADCPGVCGCDGTFYCNACGANAAGVDVSQSSACKVPDSYRATSLFTNVPRFAILKSSPTRKLCFRLTFAPTAGMGLGISGDGWAMEHAAVTHTLDDCKAAPGALPPPIGDWFAIDSGTGALAVTVVPDQCSTGINAKVQIVGAPAWAPPEEMLLADALMIEGGCP